MTVNDEWKQQASVNADNSVNTTLDGVDEKNNSSLNTTMDDMDQKESSINTTIDMCSSSPEIDELVEGIASLPLQSIATHRLQELHLYWETGIEDLMKPGHVQSGWSMINTLASFAVSNANLQKRHDEKLLPSAIMRIALDILASRGQLEKPLNSETIEHLLGKESEYVRVALELLDWILSEEIISPDLTAETQDGFDFLAALKSRYHESATKEPEGIIQSDASINNARRSVPLTPLPSHRTDAVGTGRPGLEEAGINALPVSGYEEPSIEKLHQEKKRAQMVDWIFSSCTTFVPSLPDLPFTAVYILDCSLEEHAERIYKLSDEENHSVWIAAVKLATKKEMGSVNGQGLGARRHRRSSTFDPIKVIECAQASIGIDQLGCRAEVIKHWEEEHAKTLEDSTNAPTHMQWTHLMRKLDERWILIEGHMKSGQTKSGKPMIENLAFFAVAKASLKRHSSLLLASAIMRIALDIFTSRNQLKKPINTAIIRRLLGQRSEHVPVALELLDWILSAEMILPTLTEKMMGDLDFDARNDLQKISSHMRMSHY